VKEIVGYKIDKFPFEELSKVSDLIEFDGPLLSHFTDKLGSHLLFYWVDNDEDYNRWLVWKVDKIRLHEYLLGEISLLEIFPQKSEFVFSVDIDQYINYTNCHLVYSESIDPVYLPETTAYYAFEYPDLYRDKLFPLVYLNNLQEKSLYFHLKPSSQRYKDTVSPFDVKLFFDNILKSIVEYVSIKVFDILRNRILDPAKITKAVKHFTLRSKYRVSYLNLASFEVGIAVDNLPDEIPVMDEEIEKFKETILQVYQQEVLDNDFSSEGDIKSINEKFPDEEVRKRIFEPVIKIINNPTTQIDISNFSKGFKKTYKKVGKKEQELLSPSKIKEEGSQDVKEHGVLLLYVKAVKSDQGTLFPDNIQGKVLASKPADTFPFTLEKIEIEAGKFLYFNYPIEIECSIEHNQFILSYEPLGINIFAADEKKMGEQFINELRTLIVNYLNGEQMFASFFTELIAES
jgi:hypothetical protein